MLELRDIMYLKDKNSLDSKIFKNHRLHGSSIPYTIYLQHTCLVMLPVGHAEQFGGFVS